MRWMQEIIFVVGMFLGSFVADLSLIYISNTSAATLKDANGKTMGYIKGDRVYDKHNKLLGYAKDSGTTTKGGKTLSRSKLPGLLFCR